MEEQQQEQVYEEPTNGDAYEEPQQEYQEQNHYEEPQQQEAVEAEPEQQTTEYEQPENKEYEEQQTTEYEPQQTTEYQQEHRPDRRDDDDRKIFVGGLSWETTVKDLREYFTQFGEVADCTLKTDAITGRSRGFGFVTFTAVDAVDGVCNQNEHTLHGRTIDPKRAKARGRPEPVKKVFVGGLDNTISEEDLKEHFSKYGKVVDMDLPFDKMKQQRRAFCFITFESESIVESVVADCRQSINGREVDVRKATPRQDQYGWGQQGWGQGWGDRGGRGGRGGYDRGRGRGRGRGDYGRGGPPPHQQGWGNQGWGPGYDYNYYNQGYGYDYYNQGGYPNYGGGYDYNAYYGQYNYDQSYGGQGYDQSGYDYNSWYNQQGQQQQTQTEGGDQSQSGYKPKAAATGAQRGAAQYHPYQR